MTVHIISHTHWDREWYLTYEQFRFRLVGLIDRLLDLLESRPDFEFFHLDGQTIVLEDYLELRPQQEPRLRRLIESGRILIGPWYDMPDEFLVSGESLIRNLARGHRIARRFGTPMPVGYLPDLFGHVGQMPQILRNFGLDNAILWRGFGGRKAEYWWQAPDGSRVLMMHLPPEGYCNATRVHFKPELMIGRSTKAIEVESARTAVGEVLLMNGVDHVEPHPIIPELARQLASALKIPVKHSTLPAYVDAVRNAVTHSEGPSLEVIEGELRGGEDYANLLPGVFSARVYIKQANARVQTLLEKRAEPLSTFAWMLGAPYPCAELDYAWKTLLHNHPHDSICGCSVDAVHEENMTRFARAEQVASAVADDAATFLARAVPAAAPGTVRLVAVNTTATPFSGAIEATFDLPFADAEPRRPDPEALDAPVTIWSKEATAIAIKAQGVDVPFQILERQPVIKWVMSRYETPWGLHANRVTLLLKGDVPACGYATFDVTIGVESDAPTVKMSRAGVKGDDRSAENSHLRLSINDDGTVDIVDRASGTRYQRCGELEDVADAGDEYNYSPPEHDRPVTSADAKNVRVTGICAGPLRCSIKIDLSLALPVSLAADRASRATDTVPTSVSMTVTLEADSRRVAWDVKVDNRAKDHRLRMLFPVGAAAITDVRAETAFGVVKRPARRARPAAVRMEVPVSYGPTSGFVESGDDQCGAIVMGEGLVEYEAYTDGAPRLALTLLRCVGFLSRDDLVMRPSGHAGPGLYTPGAQCLGPHEFRLAFEPRRERPTGAMLFARGTAFVAPPYVMPALEAHAGTGPIGGPLSAIGTFINVDTQGKAVLSACHKAQDTDAVLMRFFNPDKTPATVTVGTAAGVKQAAHVNFLEGPADELRVRNGAVSLLISPYGIATIVVQ